MENRMIDTSIVNKQSKRNPPAHVATNEPGHHCQSSDLAR
jgi:hypothetical protein